KIGAIELKNDPFFWINMAFLLYFTGNVLLFLGLNYLPANELKLIWPVTWVIALIRNLLIAQGFYLCYKDYNPPQS
ncbi:MAG: hypothetical protein AAFP02_26795, partial [Bacteroidota bacterium]